MLAVLLGQCSWAGLLAVHLGRAPGPCTWAVHLGRAPGLGSWAVLLGRIPSRVASPADPACRCDGRCVRWWIDRRAPLDPRDRCGSLPLRTARSAPAVPMPATSAEWAFSLL